MQFRENVIFCNSYSRKIKESSVVINLKKLENTEKVEVIDLIDKKNEKQSLSFTSASSCY